MTFINVQGNSSNCSQTSFGCCPDGINAKMNFYGTNCNGYKPYPIYQPQPIPIPVPNPIPQPQPIPVPNPIPQPIHQPIGGCAGTMFGCCPNNITAKINQQGSNCFIQNR